ncbi:DUF1570 domain-containing protein [Thermostilla marina]
MHRRLREQVGLLLRWGVAVLGTLAAAATAAALEPELGMFRLTISGTTIEGSPLAIGTDTVCLLTRDGKLWNLPRAAADSWQQVGDHFRPYAPSEFRAELLRELGNDYEVSGTTHYLIAHPRGEEDRWAARFEELYRNFVRYFGVRGFSPKTPPYPLVGVVCRDRDEFLRVSQQSGQTVSANVLGYYDRLSNRILIYDLAGSLGGSRAASINDAVILHEATHQMAFNTGLHERTGETPLWLAEGLATMFEAEGVHDSSSHPSLSDRINPRRLAEFRSLLRKRHTADVIRYTVGSDAIFRDHVDLAYPESWALVFYLTEKHPREFARYLRITASRPAFRKYETSARLHDFSRCFGNDFDMLNARFLRFVDSLP